jgi:beta-galactosidase
VTPVHVFTSGDEAELFLDGRSLGKKKKGAFEYRLRWDDVKYESGELKVTAYKNGKVWATEVVRTAGIGVALQFSADRSTINADGNDLSFLTLRIVDSRGISIPDASNKIKFVVSGPGEIVATDNGDPTDLAPFNSKERNLFSGLALVIVRANPKTSGTSRVTAEAEGLTMAQITIKSE